MPLDLLTGVVAAFAAVFGLMVLVIVARQNAALYHLRLLAEQQIGQQRAEAETQRASLAAAERGLSAAIQAGTGEAMTRALDGIRAATDAVGVSSDQLRNFVAGQLHEMREGSDARLSEIQRSVNEQLHAAVEKQMEASFARVVDQFAALQKAMADVQAVTGQIGDIKRLFSNVRTRGGWGETQVRAMLDDVLPPGAYETNWKPRADSEDAVEFAVIMPMRGAAPPRLPIDAKFPVEDYERLLTAAEAGDVEAERLARRGLERRIRDEARSIAEKYICPPASVEFGVMYLPTDGLFAEVARIPGLIDDVGRLHRVLILGPSLFPALLRTIHLGHVTLTLERRAEEIRGLLAATRTEIIRMDQVLDRLGKQAGTFAATIERARVRTRAVDRTLRGIDGLDRSASELLLGTDGLPPLDAGEPDDEPVSPLMPRDGAE